MDNARGNSSQLGAVESLGPVRSSLHCFAMLACLLVSPLWIAGAVYADEEFPPELTQFESDPRNPLFLGAGEGHWDVKIRERGWILREGNQWKMWYTGYDGTRPGQKKLGYATSTDGYVWQRDSRNPIYSEHWVEDVCIIPHEGIYYMFAEGAQDQTHLLTSRDGVSWQRVRRLDVRKVNGEPISDGPYGTPTAWFENGKWYLFYERGDRAVWLATSSDTEVFTNVKDEPVLEPGPEEYDFNQIALNQIFRHKGRYYAVFHGAHKSEDPGTPSIWSTGLAVSDDLIHWKKYAGNPLRPTKENKSSGMLIFDGERFRLYTMHNEVNVHHVRSQATP
ncbi:glycosylase [Schlesneria sp. DSM 10557]|uniref:glycosylase n=1 Tax=Schlesneria sp. DSM 10557 TaxID=3044399 RepID=UPI0035A143EB